MRRCFDLTVVPARGLKGVLATVALVCFFGTSGPVERVRAQEVAPWPPAPAPARNSRPVSPDKKRPAVPTAQPARPSTPSPPASDAPQAPRQVITVVHRLSGWKLLTWLARTRLQMLGVDEMPLTSGVHTNIVAGFVSDDGRTVVARLPRAEVEAEAAVMAQDFPPDAGESRPETADLMVVRGDGKPFKANFVGLDGVTGLSLLEASEPVLPPSDKVSLRDIKAGQRVRLFAPEPFSQKGPAGNEGFVYTYMSEAEGLLTEVKRTPAGKAVRASVRSEHLTPAWSGAIATDESGAFFGIVSQSGQRETRLVPAEAVRGAVARVLARRASVPQPWLGARGDTVALAPLESFVSSGWTREEAHAILSKHQGVLLTAVPPGTPAALAGLRVGDVIARVGEAEVNDVEDFSLMLKEAGGNSDVSFTVLRPESAPRTVIVKLRESLNPARETHFALLGPGADSLLAFGLEAAVLSSRAAALFGAESVLQIIFVRPESAAASMGLRAGDVIVSVNGQKLSGAQWNGKLSLGNLHDLSLSVVRGERKLILSLPRRPGAK